MPMQRRPLQKNKAGRHVCTLVYILQKSLQHVAMTGCKPMYSAHTSVEVHVPLLLLGSSCVARAKWKLQLDRLVAYCCSTMTPEM